MADISQVKLPNGQIYDLKDALLRNHLGDFEESSDCVPYTLRPTCDGKMDIGDRAYLDKIVGGTVAWNQLLSESNLYPHSTTIKTITPQKVVLTPNGRFSTTLHYGASIMSSALNAIPLNHVLFVCVDCASTKADKFRVRIGNTMFWSASVSANTAVRINAIAPFASATLTVYAYDDTLYSTADEITFQNWNIFDLTQMFGSTIADYIYSLEQSTPGAGVAWFRKLFPKDYYEYNPGELISVSGVSARESVGFNLFDLSRFAEEYPNFCTMSGDELTVNSAGVLFSKGVDVNIPVDMAGGYITYEIKCGTATNFRMRIVYASGTIKVIGGTSATSWQTVTRQLDTGRITAIRLDWTNAGTFYIRNLCINLSWSGERNGEYEPYVKHSYPLDSTLTLRGIPKLDSNNQLYYDGDEYLPDGTVNRRYREVLIDGGENGMAFTNSFGATDNGFAVYISAGLGDRTYNVLSDKFVCSGVSYTRMPLYGFVGGSGANATWTFILPSTVTTTAEANQWAKNNPFKILLPVTEETTETADPYLPVIPIDKWGIESFITSGIVPIGHKTRYVAKLDNLPSLAGGDGYYIIDQTGDKMSLSPITETHIPSLNASKITAGTFGADRIPALDASKISSGTLSADRIPDLGASKITSGTFAVERIPDLNASKITDGTLSADRLPASGVTAGSYGPSGNQYPAQGGTFSVPSITADAKGRVTSAFTKTVTLPTYSTATSSADGLMSATDKSKLDSMTTVPLASGLNMTEGTDGLIFTYVS